MGGRATLVAAGAALALVGAVQTAGAVPAYPDARITLEQPSGEKFDAGLYGDEWSGGHETLDGYAIEQDLESERWEYAKRSSNGRLVAGGTSATKAPPAGLDRDLQESPRHRVSRMSGPAERAPDPDNIGTQPAIVILAEFDDQATVGTSAANWASRYFGPSDSVADYYDEVSFGNLDIAPGAETSGTANDGVVGWVDLGTNHPGSDDPSGVITTQNQQTFKDAVAAADSFVDYASFDADSDGTVTPDELHITVITAGYEASICGTAFNSTWGHKWGAYNVGFPVADSVEIPEYTMFGEAHCSGGSEYMATLGIMVHEIGHDIDWPDYYDNLDSDAGDTGPNGDGGVGSWSVMATGSWAAESGEAAGETPPHPDAFNKSFQGWITPDVATGTSTQSLGQAATDPDAVQVLDNPSGVDWVNNGPSGTGEYFLIENRQQTGYDAALPGCGVLIWHIDETRPTFNNNNSVDTRRLLDLEEADNGAASTYGQAQYSAADPGDAFLGGTFDGSSAPSSVLYDGSASGVSVSNISGACSAQMTAQVTGPGGGGNNAPVLDPIGDKTATVGTELAFTATATDADSDPLTFAIFNEPDGATIDPNTGAFSFTPDAADVGVYDVDVEVSDGTDTDFETIQITVTGDPGDTTPPETTIEGGPAEGSTISGNTPQFPFSSNEAGSTFECQVDSGGFTPCNSPQPIGPLSDGPHTFEVRATDAAGNTDPTPATRNFTVDTGGGPDTTPPETTISGGPAEGSTINDDTPQFTFSSNEGGSTFECKVDGGAFASCSSPHTTSALADGSHTFQVRATDAAGNVDASPATRTFTVDTGGGPDTTPPETTIVSEPSKDTYKVKKGKTKKLVYEYGSNESGVSYECNINGTGWQACFEATEYTLGKGNWTLEARAVDAAGNVDATPVTDSIVIKKKKKKKK